jgi:hypothetical protein
MSELFLLGIMRRFTTTHHGRRTGCILFITTYFLLMNAFPLGLGQ